MKTYGAVRESRTSRLHRPRNARHYHGLTLAMVLACCRGSPSAPVEIELARLDQCYVHDVAHAGSIAAAPDLEQREAGVFEVLVQPPPGSTLRYGLPPDVSDDDAFISVVTDSGEIPLERHRDTGGEVSFSLEHLGAEPVAVRFHNRTGKPLIWTRPRIIGRVEEQGSLLPAPSIDHPQPLNVILYVVDALRYDRLSLSGYARETTPHLKRLAQRGVVFDRAYSTGSNTMTAIPPLLTGVYPGEASHRLRSQEDANGLAATFLAAGYRTAAFQGNVWLRPKAGFGEGFDSYRLIGKQTPGPTLHDQALQWLRERAATPFFLFIQTFDVHSPYNPPPPFRGRFAPQTDAPTPELTFHPAHWDDSVRAFWNTQVRKLEPDLYDDCIAFADHEIGRLVTTLDELGLRESTIVIVTADHGESLGEGGRYLHGFSVHEEQIRIPLVILLPWADGPHRRELLVSLIDVGPTLLELTGLPVPPHFQGVSLTRMEKDWPARVAIGRNTTHWFVRDGGWKLVADRRAPAQLFDLRTDSTEQRNVAAQFPVRSQYLTAVLCEHSRSYRDPKVDLLSPDAQLDEDVQRRMRKALRALGYIE